MKLFFNYNIVQGVMVSLIVALFIWIIAVIKAKIDSRKILSFLKNSRITAKYNFRSTYAIASDVKLSEDRVRKLCPTIKGIKRSQKEKESWKLEE